MNFNDKHLPLMAALIYAVFLQDELAQLRAADDPHEVDELVLDRLRNDAVRLSYELYHTVGLRYAGGLD
jgi:hypothetical protein